MDGNTVDEIDNKEELRREGNIRREIHKKEESLWICQWTRSAEAKYLAIVAAADATGFLIYKLGGFRNILETAWFIPAIVLEGLNFFAPVALFGFLNSCHHEKKIQKEIDELNMQLKKD